MLEKRDAFNSSQIASRPFIFIVLALCSTQAQGSTLFNRFTSKCADIPGAFASPLSVIQQYDCNNSAAQDYIFDNNGDGTFAIRLGISPDLCLDSWGGNGQTVLQQGCWGGVNQRWQFVQVDGNANLIQSADQSMCLQIGGESSDNGAPIISTSCDSGKWSQQFFVSNVPSAPMSITPSDGPVRPNAGPSALTSVQAISADSVVESVGVNIHLQGGIAADRYDITRYRLQDLGVRYLRDGLIADDGFLGRLSDIRWNLGIKFDIILNPIALSADDSANLIISRLGGVLTSVEGINEPDGWFSSACQCDWGSTTIDFQRQMNQVFKNRNETTGLPLLSSAFINESSYDTIGWQLGASADAVAIHPYPGGRYPENNGFGAANRGVNYGSLAYSIMNLARVVDGSKPVVATETGYNNAHDYSQANHPAPAEVIAKYLPRVVLFNKINGISRSYLYDLFDDGSDPNDTESNFGLIDSGGNPKPQYWSVKNLLQALADPGANFNPGSMNYSISGNTNALQQVLMQKQNGDFYLAVWVGGSGWNVDSATYEDPGQDAVTISYYGNFNRVQVNCPSDDGNWYDIAHENQQVQFNVKDKVCLLKFAN